MPERVGVVEQQEEHDALPIKIEGEVAESEQQQSRLGRARGHRIWIVAARAWSGIDHPPRPRPVHRHRDLLPPRPARAHAGPEPQRDSVLGDAARNRLPEARPAHRHPVVEVESPTAILARIDVELQRPLRRLRRALHQRLARQDRRRRGRIPGAASRLRRLRQLVLADRAARSSNRTSPRPAGRCRTAAAIPAGRRRDQQVAPDREAHRRIATELERIAGNRRTVGRISGSPVRAFCSASA